MIKSIKRWKKILWSLKSHERRFELLEQSIQSLANSSYDSLSHSSDYKQLLTNKEFSVHSQNGEDGLLLYIFSIIGTQTRTFVEFGISTGEQCNTANLSKNFGWGGLLMDGSSDFIAKARSYYKAFPAVNIKQCFVTTENINDAISSSGIQGEID